MSLILEALRKSEAERRRGQAPALEQELPPPATSSDRRLPPLLPWLLPVAVLALLLAAWAWQRTTTPAYVQAEPTAAADAADDPQPLPQLPPMVAPAAQPVAPAAAAADPSPAPVADNRPGTRIDPAATSANPQPSLPAPVPAAVPASADPAPRAPVMDPARPVLPTPAAPAASAVTAPTTGGLLSLADLDADTRRALPPLHVSMHMWNEDPARRFAIIDGQRLGEGGRAGQLVVQRIERDGIVLDMGGRLLRLPLR